MSASQPNFGERVRDVPVTEETLVVDLLDGRTIIVPLAWYPPLLNATAEQRSHWKVSGGGMAFTGPRSMKTRAQKDCSEARLPPPNPLVSGARVLFQKVFHAKARSSPRFFLAFKPLDFSHFRVHQRLILAFFRMRLYFSSINPLE